MNIKSDCFTKQRKAVEERRKRKKKFPIQLQARARASHNNEWITISSFERHSYYYQGWNSWRFSNFVCLKWRWNVSWYSRWLEQQVKRHHRKRAQLSYLTFYKFHFMEKFHSIWRARCPNKAKTSSIEDFPLRARRKYKKSSAHLSAPSWDAIIHGLSLWSLQLFGLTYRNWFMKPHWRHSTSE